VLLEPPLDDGEGHGVVGELLDVFGGEGGRRRRSPSTDSSRISTSWRSRLGDAGAAARGQAGAPGGEPGSAGERHDERCIGLADRELAAQLEVRFELLGAGLQPDDGVRRGDIRIGGGRVGTAEDQTHGRTVRPTAEPPLNSL
jgi:hypothetical protein